MVLKVSFDKFAKPSYISILAVSASFSAWIFPSFGVLRKGFVASESLSLASGIILAAWYSLIFVSFYLGQKISSIFLENRGSATKALALDSKYIYYLYTVLSVSGAVFTLTKIAATLSLSQVILLIGLHQVNGLKYALYEDYSVGVASLRYLVVYSSSLAIYKIITLKKVTLLHVLNIVLMIVVAFISSRLIFVATLAVSILILNIHRTKIRISFIKSALSVMALFLVLSVFNYTRNANSYEADNLSFWGAGMSEILSYLGSPFQVEIGGAKILDKLVVGGGDTYRSYVDISPALNTNSAFIGLHEQMGYVSWFYIACVCFVVGMLFSWFFSFGKSALLLPCGTMLYGSAELWRVDLFQAGIFKVWIIMGISIPLVVLGGNKLLYLLLGDSHHPLSRAVAEQRHTRA